MNKLIWIILLGINLIKAGDIQSDVEDILKSEFSSNYTLSFEKFELPGDLKSKIERNATQKFFKNYIYMWKICQGDSLAGYAILDNTYGKSLPITFLVLFSLTGEIQRVDIIRYREPYGGAIASRNWLDQFIGKISNDDFRIDKEIDSISGATISVNSVTRGVHKLSLLIEYIISNPTFNCSIKRQHAESNAKNQKNE